jgi:hypothetical protein
MDVITGAPIGSYVDKPGRPRPRDDMRRHPRLPRAMVLALLTCLMAVHPLAGSGRATGLALARWMRALTCGCEHCGAAEDAEEGGSCCSRRREPVPAPARCEERCPCAHPTEVPLQVGTPLGTPRDGGALDGRELGRGLDRAALASALTPLVLPGVPACALDPGGGFDPPGASAALRSAARAVGRDHGGLCALAARGPIAYLALLSTARL